MLHQEDSGRMIPFNSRKLTLVKIAQGEAERRLSSQMRQIVFFAFPVEEHDKEERGWQIAKYLIKLCLYGYCLESTGKNLD